MDDREQRRPTRKPLRRAFMRPVWAATSSTRVGSARPYMAMTARQEVRQHAVSPPRGHRGHGHPSGCDRAKASSRTETAFTRRYPSLSRTSAQKVRVYGPSQHVTPSVRRSRPGPPRHPSDPARPPRARSRDPPLQRRRHLRHRPIHVRARRQQFAGTGPVPPPAISRRNGDALAETRRIREEDPQHGPGLGVPPIYRPPMPPERTREPVEQPPRGQRPRQRGQCIRGDKHPPRRLSLPQGRPTQRRGGPIR